MEVVHSNYFLSTFLSASSTIHQTQTPMSASQQPQPQPLEYDDGPLVWVRNSPSSTPRHELPADGSP